MIMPTNGTPTSQVAQVAPASEAKPSSHLPISILGAAVGGVLALMSAYPFFVDVSPKAKLVRFLLLLSIGLLVGFTGWKFRSRLARGNSAGHSFFVSFLCGFVFIAYGICVLVWVM